MCCVFRKLSGCLDRAGASHQVAGYFLCDTVSVFSLAPSVAAVRIFLLLHNITHSGRKLNCGSRFRQMEICSHRVVLHTVKCAGVKQWRWPTVLSGRRLSVWNVLVRPPLSLERAAGPQEWACHTHLPSSHSSHSPFFISKFLASGDVSGVERRFPDLAWLEGSAGNTSKP